ncbi:A24 family peptidase [Paenibacillus sp. DMB20]|uniref:A24 family peptidase n=1 Tax=Paenibacillus sp. DMB20 TaxID=1642570 RepID=UPI000627D7BB|nr:A24 family peptidase [Paenibacillus sp. DMB20]KKO51170.1 peptidase A24 [Paenibacillus sp. DMB20]
MTVAYAMCAAFLAAALITDLRSMKIPNWITIPAMVLGMAYFGLTGGAEGLLYSLKGMAGGFFAVLLMYFVGAVGAGDVKLFGGIGAWCGLWFTLHAVFYSVLCAGVIGLVILIRRRETFKRMKRMAGNAAGVFMLGSLSPWNSGKQDHLRFPFMLAVLPGVIWAYFYQI